MRPYILAETNWKELKNATIDLAILPWGATEAHNYHLPYGTDNFESEAVAAEAGRIAYGKGAKIIILPNIPFGVNTGQQDIFLDMNLNPSTQLAIINDLAEVLERQKVRKLLILNSHGGNDFKTLLREVGLRHQEMFLATCNWSRSIDRSQFFKYDGDHADELETSLMLYLHPKLVLPLKEAGPGEERPSQVEGIREGWAWSERKWSRVTKDTGVGNPKASTSDKGERYFKAVTEKVADLYMELAKLNQYDPYE
ncbi:creatininase family protein [Echinicola jeungdonensis]|uniref:Creatininase family protein n=1 Tax=Echinicola jeungdonensis TaxID=709343 RepID=A0ABV5J4D7_9BACT|nr:creatininase family protein [Echinicola jeungdonensis]MDN3670113.1 creatininase family protein [Echinicola jeungdonensis]